MIQFYRENIESILRTVLVSPPHKNKPAHNQDSRADHWTQSANTSWHLEQQGDEASWAKKLLTPFILLVEDLGPSKIVQPDMLTVAFICHIET